MDVHCDYGDESFFASDYLIFIDRDDKNLFIRNWMTHSVY
jgi:hypothetical protein